MKKIPTLFKRDPDDMRHVLDEVTPGCEWVLAGEGVATRKYDGTCVSWHDNDWWFRREVKPGKTEPPGFVEVHHDTITGKRIGWEPARPASGFIQYLREAIDNTFEFGATFPEGTYELCGPRINRNPEGLNGHLLFRHADAETLPGFYIAAGRGGTLDFEITRDLVVYYGGAGWEGIVWHHPDGRMAKLKARDFR